MQNLSTSRCVDGVSAPVHSAGERLNSWKEVAWFFRREVRTVQLWEKTEGLPVRRQVHKKLGSVYAYRRELEAWWIARSASTSDEQQACEGPYSHGRRDESAQGHTNADIVRILVLPFEAAHLECDRGLSRQIVDRFAHGLREDVVTELRRLRCNPIFLPSVTVFFSDRSNPAFVKNVAREFAATFLATGTIRYSGNQARVAVQLIRGEDSTCSWSERYEVGLDNAFYGQPELAVRISQAIAQESAHPAKVQKQHSGFRETPSYHACKMGFYFCSQQSKTALIKALDYFQEAIALNSGCADAYAGLADTYISLSRNYHFPSRHAASLAKDAVETAVLLEPGSLHVRNSVINLLIHCIWDGRAAERKSLELMDSGQMDGRTLQLYSTLMISQGRHDEAISLALQGHRLEPLSDEVNGQVALAYYHAGDYESALAFARRTIELQPQFAMGHALLGKTEIERGNWDGAILSLHRALEVSSLSPCITALLAYAYAGAGDVAAAHSLLLELQERPCFPAYDVSAVHAILNQEREALQHIRRAYEARDTKTIFVNHDPRFARLRNSREFQQLASSIHGTGIITERVAEKLPVFAGHELHRQHNNHVARK